MPIESTTAQVQTSGGPMDIYLAQPSGEQPKGAVIVGFELFGVTPYIRRTTDELAKLGYVAAAPDFYHRSGHGITLNADDEGRKRGFELLGELDRTKVLEDVKAAMHYLQHSVDGVKNIGFVGLSVGGHIGFLAAAHFPLRAVAAFYPGWLTDDGISLSRPEPTGFLAAQIPKDCKMLIVVGDQDKLIPLPVRQKLHEILKTNKVDADMVVYPNTLHGFMCSERPETYNPTAAENAWERLEKFLHNALA